MGDQQIEGVNWGPHSWILMRCKGVRSGGGVKESKERTVQGGHACMLLSKASIWDAEGQGLYGAAPH